MAILAGLRLDFVGEAELLSVDVAEVASGLSLSLHETGEAGLGSSFITVSGLTSGGGCGAFAFTLVPVSLTAAAVVSFLASLMTGKGSTSLDRQTGTRCSFESTVD